MIDAIPRSSALVALAEAKPMSFWLDRPDPPDVRPALVGHERADLAVVGGGFTGLWSALLAKERDPGRDVVLIDRATIPSGASGQNGGFMLGSLVDWFHLGMFRDQAEAIVTLAETNRSAFFSDLQRHGIDCDAEPTGWVVAANDPSQIADLEEAREVGSSAGLESIWLDQEAVRRELACSKFLAGVFQPNAVTLLDPGKLAWGLKRACEALGVRIFEQTPGTAVARQNGQIRVSTPYGSVTAPKVVLGTFAHPSMLKRLTKWRVPVYQHVLVTEPLTDQQLTSLGWQNRQGFLDLDYFYHYMRLTKDNRILWGYMDATLYPNRGIGPECEQDREIFATMAEHFQSHFPQLGELRFTHSWGGALDLDSRLAPFFGTALGGRVAYAHGYVPGIGASRAGAIAMLDLLAGTPSPYTELPIVGGSRGHGRPSLRPYPPEPLLSIGMRLATAGLARQGRTGRPDPIVQVLNRAGYRF